MEHSISMKLVWLVVTFIPVEEHKDVKENGNWELHDGRESHIPQHMLIFYTSYIQYQQIFYVSNITIYKQRKYGILN